MIQTITGSLIGFNEACELMAKGQGATLFPAVVHLRDARKKSELVYTFFYRDSAGRYYDVVLNRSDTRKITASAEKLLKALSEAYPREKRFAVPLLIEKNALGADFRTGLDKICADWHLLA